MGTGVSANRVTTATTPPREILLSSGGIDSFVAWHYLGKPQALYFDLGDRNRDQEYRALDTLARRHGIRLAVSRELDLGSWELQDGVIPLRHLHLAVLACHRADTVWCSAVKGNLGADRSSAAFERLSKLISEVAGRDIRIDSPFRDMTKESYVPSETALGRKGPWRGSSGNGRTPLTWRFEPGRQTTLSYPRIVCVCAGRRHGPIRSSGRLSDGSPYGLRAGDEVSASLVAGSATASDMGLYRRTGCLPHLRRESPASVAHGRDIDNFLSIG